MLRHCLRSLAGLAVLAIGACAAEIPRSEHPRPNAVRPHWANLNGTWQFRFDPADEGVAGKWFEPGAAAFDREIVVPFPWESELSGIGDTSKASKVGWYRRTFTVPGEFPKDARVWLRFDAVDWQSDVWVNGQKVASHEGGYTPFEADVTDALKADGENVVIVRAFDATDPSLPTGKQVGWYTPSSGIWQTVWLESRPKAYIESFTITTVSLDPGRAKITARVKGAGEGYRLGIKGTDGTVTAPAQGTPLEGEARDAGAIELDVKNAVAWTPERPHLYGLELTLNDASGKVVDEIKSYFGLRTIERKKLEGEAFERIVLNGKPVYLRLALDQSFNPKGLYTAPSDEYLRRDILLAKFAGLNGLRIHIKPEEPRRLYWADTLGLLIMQDMPNTWRQNADARRAWELTMRGTIERDRNHPSIFSWVAFNETWGLNAGGRGRNREQTYPEDKDTQGWVKQMVAEIRKLDPTRLVEDNSPCNYDHVEGTDLNSWHFYIDDHERAKAHVAEVVEKSHPGSSFNYCPGETMNSAPLINSEYGAVSAGGGDRDISWGFRDLTTLLRKHNEIQGYVYTELADIEWEHNGFYNYDRSPKLFGYEEWLADMYVNELQQADFVGYDGPPVIVGKPGETITVPVFVSHYSDRDHGLRLRYWLHGYDDRGNSLMVVTPRTVDGKWEKYQVTWQEPIQVKLPDRPFVGALALTLRDPNVPQGNLEPRFAANFVNIVVKPDAPLPRVQRRNENTAVLRFAPEDYAASRWTEPADAPPGKVYGRGKGYFEYRLKVPEAVLKARPTSFYLTLEAGSKADRQRVAWPERVNRQDYPQSDARPWKGDAIEDIGSERELLDRMRERGQNWPSTLSVSLNGEEVLREELEDDAADARGVLSHLNRVEHGSYGELMTISAPLPERVRKELADGKPLVVRLAVPEDASPAGGLTVFGATTGMYPFEPTVELITEEPLPESLGVDPAQPVAIDRAVMRRVPVLPSGDGQAAEPPTWAYTTSDPGAGWEQIDFDDAKWERGRAGFGTDGTPAVQVRTRWDGPRIWLRTQVELPELSPNDRLSLRLFHDEDVEVHVNGKKVYEAEGYVTDYGDIGLDATQKAAFRPGRNTIAVSCRQTGGGQGIDVGLLLLKADTSE